MPAEIIGFSAEWVAAGAATVAVLLAIVWRMLTAFSSLRSPLETLSIQITKQNGRIDRLEEWRDDHVKWSEEQMIGINEGRTTASIGNEQRIMKLEQWTISHEKFQEQQMARIEEAIARLVEGSESIRDGVKMLIGAQKEARQTANRRERERKKKNA